MSTHHYGLILVVVLFFAGCTRDFSVSPEGVSARELTADEKALVSCSNTFGFRLFQEVVVVEEGKNVFISPLSVAMALAMTYNGAAGETEEAMRSTLGFADLTGEQLNEAFKGLTSLLLNLDPEVQVQIANSIWYRQGLDVEADFVHLNRTYFDALVQALDFSDPGAPGVINAWVDQNTHGKIKEIIDRIDPLAMMFLINAIYFKGTWTYQFDEQNTRDDFFNGPDGSRIPCRMMTQSGDSLLYFETEDFQAIDLPYGRGRFSMTIFLPRPGGDPGALVAVLDAETWAQWAGRFRRAKGTVYLPKFKLEYEITLNAVLERLGMGIAFDPTRADFSRMVKDERLYISLVKHKSFVQVDEEGTEAAAVTVVGMEATAVGPHRFVMRIDRPFVFLIRENRSQTVLFAGVIAEPKWD